jgi:N-acetylglucosaminyldiphosphoundecaprenol N-acetyl-beta-D-mannosaminyltransferase
VRIEVIDAMTLGMPSARARSNSAHTCSRLGSGTTVNGVRIDPVDRALFTETVDSFLACGLSHVVHFLPADPIVRAMDNRGYREVLNAGELNVPDGKSVVWALRLKGARSDRLAGGDAMEFLVRNGEQHGFRHYLFGGGPAVLTALRTRLEQRYPKIELTGAESPPFRALEAGELEEAAARIGEVNTQFLWIGLGTPKQDLVAATFRDLGAAPVILCVGAAFDFLAGTKRRAPEWMQRTGLEWVYRLWLEPGRLGRRYLVGNPRFMWGVARELLSRRNG